MPRRNRWKTVLCAMACALTLSACPDDEVDEPADAAQEVPGEAADSE